MKATMITIVVGSLRTVSKSLEERLEKMNYPDYSFVEIGKNTEKSPGHTRRPAKTKTPVKVLRWCEKFVRSKIILLSFNS